MPKETAVYTHGHHESVLRSHTWRTAANSAAYLLVPELRPGHAGPGHRLRSRHHHRRPGRAGRARARSPASTPPRTCWTGARDGRRTRPDNVRFAVADVHALDFPDDSFDVVHAHQVLQHVGDPVQALREMRRVCRPGGIVAVRDSDYGGHRPGTPKSPGWTTGWRCTVGWPGRTAVSRTPAAGCTPGPGAPGSPDGHRHRLRLVLRHARASATWWSGLWADRTTASAYAELAVEGGHATPGQLADIAAGWRAWGRQDDGWFMVPHGEMLCRVR